MLKKVLATILAMSMLLSIFAGCSGGETSEQAPSSTIEGSSSQAAPAVEKVLYFNHGAEPKSWDPSVDDSSGSTVIGNIFEGLMRDNQDGSLGYGQAKEYKISDDQLKYTFTLRDDIKWSDGKPVTAKDFEYAWKRLIDPSEGAAYAYMGTSYIKNAEKFYNGEIGFEEVGIKAVDDRTFEIELETQVPFFLNLTTFFCFMPVRQDIIEANGDGWEKDPAKCISNGPFVLTDYKIGDYMVISKNKEFYDQDLVKIDQVKFEFITEATTALNAYMGGDIHINSLIPPAELPSLIANEPNLVYAPRMATEYIIFNVDVAPMNDVKVRKALSLALDRKALTDSVLKGGETPATGVIPPVLTFSDGVTSCRKLDANGRPTMEYDIDPNSARIEEAQKLLAEAGYPNGEGFPKIKYNYVTSESRKKLSEAIQQMWKNNLNIDIELDNMEWQVLVDKRKRGDFIISGGNWVGDYADPMTFFDAFAATSGWNECQWRWKETDVAPHDKTLNATNKEFEDEVVAAQRSQGEERDQHLKNAENILMSDMVIAPMYYRNYCYLIDQARVQNVWRNKIGEFKFWNAEIIA